MRPIVTQTTGRDGRNGLHVDLAIFEAPMREALHRAAIFLGYAAHTSEIAPLKSMTLKGPINLDVGLPDVIPPKDRKGYQTEFTQWAIGQGLIEIDQSYHRYLVSAIDTLADVEDFLQGRPRQEHRKPNLANTWKVHEQFFTELGQQSPEHDVESGWLRSLVNARNCLAHDGGTVTRKRIVDGSQTMVVCWPGFDMVKVDQNGRRAMVPLDRHFRGTKEDVLSLLSMEEVVRKHEYAVGDRMRLSQTDLAEIIFFYQLLAKTVGGEMHRIVGEKIVALNNYS